LQSSVLPGELWWQITRLTVDHRVSGHLFEFKVTRSIIHTMLFTKVALIVSSLAVLAAAQEADASSKGLTSGRGRSTNPNAAGRLMSKRDLEKRCTGTCEECFGSGYTLCPGSSIFCYLPGDATYGLDSCSSDSYDSTPTTTASSSSSTGITGVDDICSQAGATCQSCFGPTVSISPYLSKERKASPYQMIKLCSNS
jgi:hypothetical protein